jgi:hypothetical protein
MELYPRPLRAKELELLHLVLPRESDGYRKYRDDIAGMVVLAEGRRGKGNFVLGHQGDRPDISSPLAAVIAYGVVETADDEFTITVRECIGNQIDVEIVSRRGEEVPDALAVKRSWTYSTWKPGLGSPASRQPVREVRITETLTLAIAAAEKRLWLHDAALGMNHPIPITNFYNEVMLHKHIRDPKIALNSSLFYEQLDRYTDEDLRSAFIAYNRVRPKVIVTAEEPPPRKGGLKSVFQKLFPVKR